MEMIVLFAMLQGVLYKLLTYKRILVQVLKHVEEQVCRVALLAPQQVFLLILVQQLKIPARIVMHPTHQVVGNVIKKFLAIQREIVIYKSKCDTKNGVVVTVRNQ